MRKNNYLCCKDPIAVLKESLLDVICCLIHAVRDRKGLATPRGERKFGARDGTTLSNRKYFRLLKMCASSFYGLLPRDYPESSLSLQLTEYQVQSRFNPGVVSCWPLSKQSKQK